MIQCVKEFTECFQKFSTNLMYSPKLSFYTRMIHSVYSLLEHIISKLHERDYR